MKKHTIDAFRAGANKFKASIKQVTRKKNPRYIYTEDDLGEGLLDAGINSTFVIGQRHNYKVVPWISMLRSKIS